MSSCGKPECFATCQCDAECDPDAELGFVIHHRISRGESIEIEYELVDVNGAPVDLNVSGSKIWFTVKDYLEKADSQALWQGTLGSGIVQTTIGRATVLVAAAATQYLPDGVVKVYYSLRFRDFAGRVATLEKGIFDIEPDVTRSI